MLRLRWMPCAFRPEIIWKHSGATGWGSTASGSTASGGFASAEQIAAITPLKVA